jgi:hypothetical protein
MFDEEIANPLAYVAGSPYELARILVVAAFIAAVALIARRKPRLYLAVTFLGVSAGMALIAWDLHRVTTTEPLLARVLGSARIDDTDPTNDYMTIISSKSNHLLLLLSGIVFVFMFVQLCRAYQKRMALTCGAAVIALVMLYAIQVQQLQYAGDMYSPMWRMMENGVSNASMVLLIVTGGYVLLVVGVIVKRLTVRTERKKAGVVTPASETTQSSVV